MKHYITQDNLFSLCDSMEYSHFKCGKWTPTEKEIEDFIVPRMEDRRMLLFVAWILETGVPITDIDRRNRQRLMCLLNDCVFSEEEEESKKRNIKGGRKYD